MQFGVLPRKSWGCTPGSPDIRGVSGVIGCDTVVTQAAKARCGAGGDQPLPYCDVSLSDKGRESPVLPKEQRAPTGFCFA